MTETEPELEYRVHTTTGGLPFELSAASAKWAVAAALEKAAQAGKPHAKVISLWYRHSGHGWISGDALLAEIPGTTAYMGH